MAKKDLLPKISGVLREIFSAVAACMLLGSFLSPPLSYYDVLRLVVFGAAIYMIITAPRSKLRIRSLLFIAVAFIFNPFMPLHMSVKDWHIADVVCAAVFIINIVWKPKSAAVRAQPH